MTQIADHLVASGNFTVVNWLRDGGQDLRFALGSILSDIERVLFTPSEVVFPLSIWKTVVTPRRSGRSLRLMACQASGADAFSSLGQPCPRFPVTAGSAVIGTAQRLFSSARQTGRVEFSRSRGLSVKTDTAGDLSCLGRTLPTSWAQAVGFPLPLLGSHPSRCRFSIATIRFCAAVRQALLALSAMRCRWSQATAIAQPSPTPPIVQPTHTDGVRIGRVRARHRHPSSRALGDSPRPGRRGHRLFGRDPRAGDRILSSLSRAAA